MTEHHDPGDEDRRPLPDGRLHRMAKVDEIALRDVEYRLLVEKELARDVEFLEARDLGDHELARSLRDKLRRVRLLMRLDDMLVAEEPHW